MAETLSQEAARRYRQDREYSFYDPTRFVSKEVVLNRIVMEARQAVSNDVLARAEWGVREQVQQDITMMFAKMAFPGKQQTETVKVVEKPRYLTWKHQLIAELPRHSFRQRFLERFFRINTLEREIVSHTFTADTGYVFPECRLTFPDTFGRISFLTDARVDSEILDALP